MNGIHEVVGSIPFTSNFFYYYKIVSEKLPGNLDPQIASLIGLTNEKKVPDFDFLFRDDTTSSSKTSDPLEKKFKLCSQFQGKPHPVFCDKDYYKKVLSNEGETARRVHENLSQFLAAREPADKSIFRGRLIPAFWDLGAGIAGKINQNPDITKIFLLRYGILSPAFLSPQQTDIISRLIIKNETEEPVYYLDEWLTRIARGLENASATDELKPVRKDPNQKLFDKMDKVKGQKEYELSLLRNKVEQRNVLETKLLDNINLITDHTPGLTVEGISGPYSDNQKKLLAQTGDILKQLYTNDRDIDRTFSAIYQINRNLDSLDQKVGEFFPDEGVDSSVVIEEFNTIRQMTKLCIGRKGNHFPILMKNYFRPGLPELGIRENIINELAIIESLDNQLFYRTFKNQTNRIVPNIILLPCYGDSGICWEPFERHNKASSKGRIAIPMFPKNLRIAVLAACADLRWQVAKEKAQHYWMEEGITGKYYTWFQERKIRGDVRASFINDYILWITKESDGVQKLDRKVRGIFWRMIPFPQEIKDKIRNRGFVYNELYKKDMNIARSDGY